MTRPGIDRRSILALFRRPATAEAVAPAADSRTYMRRINAAACNGCDVCARICPQGALRLHEIGDEASYVVNPRRCDGCALCWELCEVGAIETQDAPVGPVDDIVPLARLVCERCRAPFHVPVDRAPTTRYCSVCARRLNSHGV